MEINMQVANKLRGKLLSRIAGNSVLEIVAALQMVIVDVIEQMPGATEQDCMEAAEAIASDVRSIIRERFAFADKAKH